MSYTTHTSLINILQYIITFYHLLVTFISETFKNTFISDYIILEVIIFHTYNLVFVDFRVNNTTLFKYFRFIIISTLVCYNILTYVGSVLLITGNR